MSPTFIEGSFREGGWLDGLLRRRRTPLELWWALAAAGGAGEGDVGQLLPLVHPSEHQPAPAHVAAPGEFDREAEALAEDAQQHVDVLARRDAAEQHDL